jgi:hypothetical protein
MPKALPALLMIEEGLYEDASNYTITENVDETDVYAAYCFMNVIEPEGTA